MMSSSRALGCAGFDFRLDSGIDAQIILGHSPGAEALFENSAAFFATELRDAFELVDGLLDAVDDKTRDTFIDDFRHRTAAKRHRRGAAGHSFDHHETEGLRPIDRKDLRIRVREERLLFLVADLADIFDQWMVE